MNFIGYAMDRNLADHATKIRKKIPVIAINHLSRNANRPEAIIEWTTPLIKLPPFVSLSFFHVFFPEHEARSMTTEWRKAFPL